MRRIFNLFLSFAILGLVGFLLVNYVLMPMYVRWHGEVRVPSLTFTTLPEAKKMLEERGLQYTIKDTLFRSGTPQLSIIDQFPDAGDMVREGRRIQLTISMLPGKKEMPDLISKTLRHAKIILEELGLPLDSVQYDSSDYYHEGVVIAQSIPAADSVNVRNIIILTVSKGKRNAQKSVPNVVNLGEQKAREILEEHGFTVGLITTMPDSILLPRTVISQSWNPGARFPVERKVQVDLIISVDY